MPRAVLKVYPSIRRLHLPTHIVVCVAQNETLARVALEVGFVAEDSPPRETLKGWAAILHFKVATKGRNFHEARAKLESKFKTLSKEAVPSNPHEVIEYLRTRLVAFRSGITPRVPGSKRTKRTGLGDYRVVKQVAQELNYFDGFMAFDARTVDVDQVLQALEVLGVTSKRPLETNAMAVVSQREDVRMCFLSIE